ncbi:hypothetical protein EBR21_14770 [bacterium]|nr:hypothetical protein [bacterium]
MSRFFSVVAFAATFMGFGTRASAAELFSEEMSTNKPVVLKQMFELPKGIFTVESKWTTVQQTSSETDVLFGKVSFKANPKAVASHCQSISFIQTARIQDNKGRDFQWPSGQSVRNEIRTQRDSQGVEQGYFIDHDAVNCDDGRSSCSPFFRDHWPNSDVGSQDGSVGERKVKAAVLMDFPYGWELIASAALETCAVCRDSNEVYGCVTWGGTWPLTGERYLHDPVASESQSKTFAKALSMFEAHYKSKFQSP